MSFTWEPIWPMRLDLSSLECRQILREKELLCYSDVVSVLRAQGPLSDEKRSVLMNLQKILSISDERNKAELRRAANNEKLATIAENVSGFDGYTEWASLGALKFPPTNRPTPRTIYCDQASQTSLSFVAKERDFPSPVETHDGELSEKHESSITTNRIVNKDRRPVKSNTSDRSHCSTFTMTEPGKPPSQELFKPNVSKDSNSSHDYNLHLLSEIATGESNQSELGDNNPLLESSIKPDSFSIHNQINDIDQQIVNNATQINTAVVVPIIDSIPTPTTTATSIIHSRGILLSTASNVVLSGTIKSNAIHEFGGPLNPVPMVISNSVSGTAVAGSQRYVLPRSSITQNISLISANSQKSHHQIGSFIAAAQAAQSAQSQSQSQSQSSSGSYLTLSSSQLRSPPAPSVGWSGGGGGAQGGQGPGQAQTQPQQLFIQNVSSHHPIGLQQAGITAVHQHHQSGDYNNSLVHSLKQRALTIEQHKTQQQQQQQQTHQQQQQQHHQVHPVNSKLVVRNLGSQAITDSERNKRFMVVKGSSGSGSMGPSNKKPKISNPSNRQPGRPPLMPAPSSAYTSRPYVANEIFHSNRSINTISSISDTSSSSNTDSNGLKISSISSGSRGVTANSSQTRPNSFYSVSRGNGLQRTPHSSNSSSVVQLGSSVSHIHTLDSSANAAGSNTLRPKNIQPVISVVPLSPRGLTTTDSVISSNVSILGNSNKDDSNDQNTVDKDSSASFKITSKEEVYASLIDRINQPPMVSLNQTENKIQ